MLVIFVAAMLFMEFRVTIDTRHMDRFSTELAEAVFSSPLTVDRAVFDKEKLDEYNSYAHKRIDFFEISSGYGDSKKVINVFAGGEEPFVRQCYYGYHLTIEDSDAKEQSCQADSECKSFCRNTCGLAENDIVTPIDWELSKASGREKQLNCWCNNICKCKNYEGEELTKSKWEIGYKVIDVPAGMSNDLEVIRYHTLGKPLTNTYPILIAVQNSEGGYDYHIGQMTLDVYDTWLSQISCLVEDAWKMKQIRRMQIPCINMFPTRALTGCYIPLRKSGNYLCIFDKNKVLYSPEPGASGDMTYDVECRYLPGITVETFDTRYAPGKSSYRELRAIPIKEGSQPDCSGNNLPADNENVGTVILCLAK
ncbi:MAG: hypothetical protein HZB67_00825 [Candidatus Aenigmarchaeota archaeon]|nr:hypothetical protein [Candidatus Aenigmarchaeota archaeon]